MLKVVIVDDEILIRVGIKSSIDWEEHGFEIAGQAENGVKALEVIEDTHPDIVLTDIKMPKMDGLELIKEIKKRYPKIIVIVLSCYNEVDYVKSAMKLGAEDYLYKLSIEPESLLDVLTKVKGIKEDAQTNENILSNVEKELRRNKYIIKENAYRKILSGSISYEDFARELEVLGININKGEYEVLCCSIDDYSNAPSRSKIDDQYLFKFSFINILEEIMVSEFNCEIAEVENGEYIIILKIFEKNNIKNYNEMLVSCLKRVNTSLRKYLNISVSVGIMPVPVNFSSFRDNYFRARQAMKLRFYSGKGSISIYNGHDELEDKDIVFGYVYEKRLLCRLDDFDVSGVKEVINTFFDETLALKIYEPGKVRKVAVEIFHSLMNFIKKYDSQSSFLADNFTVHPLDLLMTADTLTDIRDWFSEFIDKLYDYIYSQQQEAKRPEVKKLIKYINENINESITLDKASKISNISKCYLSSIFKKETGEAFVDYINRAKMMRAKELIQENGLRIYEAAEKVGISDESYFSKLFKKYMGVSPSKLIRSCKE